MIVFDIEENIGGELGHPEHYSINASPSSTNFLYEDEDGYNCFWISRTSQIELIEPGLAHQQNTIQRARFQIFTLYNEKIGIIMGEEFLIQKDEHGTRAQTIG